MLTRSRYVMYLSDVRREDTRHEHENIFFEYMLRVLNLLNIKDNSCHMFQIFLSHEGTKCLHLCICASLCRALATQIEQFQFSTSAFRSHVGYRWLQFCIGRSNTRH